MDILEWIVLLVVAGVCGALAQWIVGFSRGGLLVSIGVGLVGAVLGTWLARAARLPELWYLHIGETTFPIVWAIIGAVIFVALVSAATTHRQKRANP